MGVEIDDLRRPRPASSRRRRAPGRAGRRPRRARRQPQGPREASARRGSASRPPAASITGRAFTRASSSSARGSESASDAAAGADPDPVAVHLERPDRHVQLESRQRARVADRAGVGLAPGRLELGDHAHRLDLRRAGDRAGRERRTQQVGVADLRPQRALDGRHQVPDARRRARLRQLGHADRAVLAHASEVVAHQVDDHHVLGAVLGRGGERVPGRPSTRGAVPLIGSRQHLAAAAAQEELGREAADGAPRPGDEGGVARHERARRAREQVDRVRPRQRPSRRRQTFAWKISPAAMRSRHRPRLRGRARPRPAARAGSRPTHDRPLAHAGREASPRGARGARAARRRARRVQSASNHQRPAGRAAAGGRRSASTKSGSGAGRGGDGGTDSSRRAEPVAEVAEPATADGVARVAGGLDLGLHGRAARTGRLEGSATTSGSEPTSAPPPAQSPVSVKGRTSPRTSSARDPRACCPGAGSEGAGHGWAGACGRDCTYLSFIHQAV